MSIVLAVSLLWVSAAVEAYLIPCPLNEDEVFRGVENASVPETVYELYTRKNMYIPQSLTDEASIRLSNYDPAKRTVIATHGYQGNPTSLYLLKSAYLRYMDCNFIIVDWKLGASEADYVLLVRNVAIVARFIANGLEELKKLTGCNLSNVHLIGWSLGGQLVGFIGKYVWSGKIGRITALDPAGVCFAGFSPQHRLHIFDADLVDVITTNGGPVILNEPTGHLNFACDGGNQARGCGNIKPDEQTNDSVPLDDCSHVRAVELFTSSLGHSQCLFVGYACQDYDTYERGDCFDCGVDGKNCAAMGIHTEKYTKTTNESVMMYLDTTFNGMFCLFQYHCEVRLTKTQHSKHEVGVMYVFINAGQSDEEEILLQPRANKVRTPEWLLPGETYTYLIQSHKGPQSIKIKTIHFLWVSFQSREDSMLFIQCLTIVPMNNLQTNRDDITLYATGNNVAVPPDTMVPLQIATSC